MNYEIIAKALFESYESIYDINVETNEYICYHESESYSMLKIKKTGSDFFAEMAQNVPNIITAEDVDYVVGMLDKKFMVDELSVNKYLTFMYRIHRDGEDIYHQIRATLEKIDGAMHILMGIRDIDAAMRTEIAHYNEVSALERELQLMRIRSFTSQMKPHYLYNVLGSIQEAVLTDPEYGSELLEAFSVHLRSFINVLDGDSPVPFSRELESIKAYVTIEKMRLGDKLTVDYSIDADEFMIPPLSIQPLVENSIRHGIYGRGKAGGLVSIITREESDSWVIVIEDDGIGFDLSRAPAGESSGIRNSRFRLSAICNATLDIRSEIGKGTTVTVTVPKEQTNESDNSRR